MIYNTAGKRDGATPTATSPRRTAGEGRLSRKSKENRCKVGGLGVGGGGRRWTVVYGLVSGSVDFGGGAGYKKTATTGNAFITG